MSQDPSPLPDPAGRTPSTAELVDALLTTMNRMRAHFSAAAATVGVTPTQAKALRELAEPLTLKDLAARLGADVSNTSSTVDRLEAKGLIRKEAHQSDRRARMLTLTEDGTRVRHALQKSAFDTVPVLDRLDPAQRRELYALLRLTATP